MKLLVYVASVLAFACIFLASADHLNDRTLESEKSYPTPVRDSPLLPRLLESLNRDRNAPKTATRLLDEYDYIVVGAGTAGSALAGRLSEIACVSVLLLEAGKLSPILTDVPAAAISYLNSDLDWKYVTVPQLFTGAGMVDQVGKLPSGRGTGGSSMINAMVAVRGNRRDFDSWAAGGAEGWSYAEVLPYFLKLEDYTDPEYKYNGYHNTSGPVTIEKLPYSPDVEKAFSEAAESSGFEFVDVNGPSQLGFYEMRETMRKAQRCSTAKAYLVPAEDRPNLDIVTHAYVTKVEIQNRRATGVQIDFKGESYTVRARREVILSAGTIGSAKLLLLSGIGPAEDLEELNIDVVADLPVGENLQDHATVPINFALDENKIQPFDKRLNEATIKEYLDNRTGPLTVAYAEPLLFFLKSPDLKTPGDVPDYQTYLTELVVDDNIREYLNLETQVFEEVYEPYRNKPIFTCCTFAANPSSRGTLKLRSTCPYDMPLIDPRYFEHPLDVEKVIAGMKVCLDLVRTTPMLEIGTRVFDTVYPGCEDYEMYSDDYLRCVVRTTFFAECHFAGTAKMGHPDDPTAVLDPRLRVKTIRGLRVVDNSIMPTLTAGNTMLAAIMIGEKAADMIKEDLFNSETGASVLISIP